MFNKDLEATPACPGGTIYTIKPGDALYSLARRFKTSVTAIINANPGLIPTQMQLGQSICIPVAPAPGPCPGGFAYTVKSGDTFYRIAQRAAITVPALAAANPDIDMDALRIGQQLCIPAIAPPPPTCPGRLYTVKPGDTFYRIARQFSYALDALLEVNPGVNPDALVVGQTLCLPPSPGGGPFPCPAGSIHIIQAGDTLYSIAQRRGISLNTLLAANPQVTDITKLTVGDPVCIPG